MVVRPRPSRRRLPRSAVCTPCAHGRRPRSPRNASFSKRSRTGGESWPKKQGPPNHDGSSPASAPAVPPLTGLRPTMPRFEALASAAMSGMPDVRSPSPHPSRPPRDRVSRANPDLGDSAAGENHSASRAASRGVSTAAHRCPRANATARRRCDSTPEARGRGGGPWPAIVVRCAESRGSDSHNTPCALADCCRE